MRFFTALLVLALGASSALAAPLPSEERLSLTARGTVGKIVDSVANHLEKHASSYKTIGKAANGVYQAVNNGRSISDDEDDEVIAERELGAEFLAGLGERGLFSIVGKVVKSVVGGSGGGSSSNQNQQNKKQRSLDDVDDEWDFGARSDMDDEDLLDERGLFGIVGKVVKGVVGHSGGSSNSNQN